MTITVADDCTTITLVSQELVDFDADPTNKTLTIKGTINCCTETELEVTVDDLEDDSSYIVDPDFFDFSSTFNDGVYLFIVEVVDSDTSTTTTDSKCALVDCELQCEVFGYVVNNVGSINAVWAEVYYDTLTYTHDCDDCECEKACIAIEELLGLLNKSTDDCNCR